MSQPVTVTKTRDSEGWRRARCGKNDAQISVIIDDHTRRICLLDNWITAEQIPNLIAALQAAEAEIQAKNAPQHFTLKGTP